MGKVRLVQVESGNCGRSQAVVGRIKEMWVRAGKYRQTWISTSVVFHVWGGLSKSGWVGVSTGGASKCGKG